MKKTMVALFTIISFMFILTMGVQAATTVNKDKMSKGYVTVTYDGDFKNQIKVQVIESTGEKTDYQYDITSNKPTNIPLHKGSGNYTINVLQRIAPNENKYKKIVSDTFKAEVKDPTNEMYLVPSPIVNFNNDMTPIKTYKEMLDKLKDSKAAADANNKKIIDEMYAAMMDYKYDFDKASTVQGTSGYVPDIEKIYASKKGICFDYSAMLASALRTEGIPTRLVMGYSPEVSVYHAWNEILIGGKWVPVDSTSDAAYAQAGLKYTMERDPSKLKVVKVY